MSKCYCGESLRPDGTCRHGCPLELRPSHQRKLRSEEKKRIAERERASTIGPRENLRRLASAGYASMLKKAGRVEVNASTIRWARARARKADK